jgi:hypothetical protein
MYGWRKYYPFIKWSVLLLSYGFLIYKIIEFTHSPASKSEWYGLSWNQWGWLLFALCLLPINVGIETVKWRYLIASIERLTLPTAIKSVFSGYATGFFTPNRVGEYPGRSVYLPTGTRWKAITFGMVGTLAQTMIILLFGLLSFCLLVGHRRFPFLANEQLLTWLLIVEVVLSFTIYLLLPRLSRFANRWNISIKVNTLLQWLSTFRTRQLSYVLFLAFLRYIVFCLQLYCMLRFCSIHITVWQGMVAISSFYLFVTFTPSIAFSEAAIRGSFAVIFVGMFSTNTVGIALAGVLVWFVDAVIPMIIGSVFFSKTKIEGYSRMFD